MNRLLESVLEQPAVYRLWQSWHEDQKFAPVLAHNNLSRVRRVLDIGCGPGTNSPLFVHADYLGIDINPAYVGEARRRYHRDFQVADATNFSPPANKPFDFILLNSLLHHIDLGGVRSILSHVPSLLTAGGTVHILDLVLPEDAGIARTFARLDRGRFARPVEEWRGLFCESLEPLLLHPYTLTVFGIGWLDMIYFKGAAKR